MCGGAVFHAARKRQHEFRDLFLLVVISTRLDLADQHGCDRALYLAVHRQESVLIEAVQQGALTHSIRQSVSQFACSVTVFHAARK